MPLSSSFYDRYGLIRFPLLIAEFLKEFWLGQRTLMIILLENRRNGNDPVGGGRRRANPSPGYVISLRGIPVRGHTLQRIERDGGIHPGSPAKRPGTGLALFPGRGSLGHGALHHCRE